MARYERPQRFHASERHDRAERERYDRPERYERAERWSGSRWDRGREREPVRVPSRGVRTWEQSHCQGDDEYGVEGKALRPAKLYARSPSCVVPHSLSAHTDIDAAMAAAEYIQKDDIEVACICT